MTDLDGLLHAVLANPDDDTPRLIYADAMEESREPINHARAEFIRLQIAGEGEDRQTELLPVWLGNWFGREPTSLPSGWWAVGHPGDPTAFQLAVSRGFIDRVANHGLPPAPWDEWTAWHVAEGLAGNVTVLLENHPLRQIILDVHTGEEFWIEPPDATNLPARWECRSADGRVLSRYATRSGFVADLSTALRDRAFTLALGVWDAQRGRREVQMVRAAIQRLALPPRDG